MTGHTRHRHVARRAVAAGPGLALALAAWSPLAYADPQSPGRTACIVKVYGFIGGGAY